MENKPREPINRGSKDRITAAEMMTMGSISYRDIGVFWIRVSFGNWVGSQEGEKEMGI